MQDNTDLIDILSKNREALIPLLDPYLGKLDAGKPLTPQEQTKFNELMTTYGELEDEIDRAWQNLVIMKKVPFWKFIFRKN